MRNFFRQLGSVIVFVISIAALGLARSGRCLEVSNDTIDNVLSIFVGVLGRLLMLVVAHATIAFVVSFFILVRLSRAGHLIYANDVFDFFLHDESDLGSNTYSSIRYQ